MSEVVPNSVRIPRLHDWYRTNVMKLPLTAEVERLWLAFFKQGFNGPDLKMVILYLRGQIRAGKRNEGALKLTNLLERTEDGTLLKFAQDLGLAESAKHGRRPLTPLPDGEVLADGHGAEGHQKPMPDAPKGPTREQIEEMNRNFEKLRSTI